MDEAVDDTTTVDGAAGTDVTGRGDRGGRDEAVRRFVERFALLMTEAGMPRMAGRVFAAVLVDADGRLTAGELAERLGVSPAAVSGAVRYLVDVAMFERRREPGERADHYALAGGDMWSEMLMRRLAILEGWERALAEGAAVVDPASPARRRLRESEAFLAYVARELPGMLDRWRATKESLVAEAEDRAG